jgi:hypothetical protein
MSTDRHFNETPYTTDWFTASDGNGSCVEVRRHGINVEVRDTKDREGGVQSYTLAEFDAFLSGVREGKFDRFIY